MSNTFNQQCTIILKALLPYIIILHHLSQKIDFPILKTLFLSSGNLVVSIFFFISGYGLTKSFLQKKNYLNNFLQHRIFTICKPFIITIIIYQIYKIINHQHNDFKDTLLQFLFQGKTNDILPASWFIIAIIYFYIAFFIAFSFKRKIIQISLSILFFLAYFVYCHSFHFDSYWWISYGAGVIGILWGMKVETITLNHLSPIVLAIISFTLFLIMYGQKTSSTNFISFCIFPIFIASLFYILPPPISNKIANLKPIMFLSSISLEIYLIHPIIMRMISFMDDNYMSYIIFTMIFSTISAFFIKKISTKNIIKFKPIKLQ